MALPGYLQAAETWLESSEMRVFLLLYVSYHAFTHCSIHESNLDNSYIHLVAAAFHSPFSSVIFCSTSGVSSSCRSFVGAFWGACAPPVCASQHWYIQIRFSFLWETCAPPPLSQLPFICALHYIKVQRCITHIHPLLRHFFLLSAQSLFVDIFKLQMLHESLLRCACSASLRIAVLTKDCSKSSEMPVLRVLFLSCHTWNKCINNYKRASHSFLNGIGITHLTIRKTRKVSHRINNK